MHHTAQSILAPVYPALAEWIAERYEIGKAEGIGIDLGSGPGDLIIELSRRTEGMFWINADINTYGFRYMQEAALAAGVAHRVGAVFADAHAMPFRDDYADLIVSRGTFQFWKDSNKAFAEIYRVLKPGGTALIGRGYSGNLAPEKAAAIREAHGDGGPKYDIDETAAELRTIMTELDIRDFHIIIPSPPGALEDYDADIKYGIWLEFRKKGEPKAVD